MSPIRRVEQTCLVREVKGAALWAEDVVRSWNEEPETFDDGVDVTVEREVSMRVGDALSEQTGGEDCIDDNFKPCQNEVGFLVAGFEDEVEGGDKEPAREMCHAVLGKIREVVTYEEKLARMHEHLRTVDILVSTKGPAASIYSFLNLSCSLNPSSTWN